MKKTFILTALGVILTVPTFAAVQKCIAMTADTTCSDWVAEEYSYDWSVTCNRIPVKGIAVIADNNVDDVADSLTHINGSQCWCKIVSPVVSKWAWVSVTTKPYCAIECATHMINDSEFRGFIMSSFSD